MKRNVIILVLCLLISNFSFAQDDSNNDVDKSRLSAADANVPGELLLDIGFNFLVDESPSMKMDWWGSKVVNLYYYRSFRIGSHFSINPGIGVGLEKYSFDNAVNSIRRGDDGLTEIFPLPEEWDKVKSKIAANYLDIPIEFRYHGNKTDHERGFRAAIGGKVGYLFENHSKVVYKEDGIRKTIKNRDDFNLNRIRYGIIARAGLRGISAFGYYSLSELFKKDLGPEDTNPASWTVGITVSLF
jgi:hypothetical protein